MYNSTSSQRIGTADLKQVEYLRKLSERNRQRRIAAENTKTGQMVWVVLFYGQHVIVQ